MDSNAITSFYIYEKSIKFKLQYNVNNTKY